MGSKKTFHRKQLMTKISEEIDKPSNQKDSLIKDIKNLTVAEYEHILTTTLEEQQYGKTQQYNSAKYLVSIKFDPVILVKSIQDL